jgi:hypothetical protein
VAGIAYYVGTPPSLQSVQSLATVCPPQAPLLVIPQGLGAGSGVGFQLPTLMVVIGVNNTVGWNDEDTTVVHVASSMSVPPDSLNWDLNMTGGRSYCVTLPAAGTYSYEIGFSPSTYAGIVVVKSAS